MGAHVFKRVAPDLRANMGDKGRGVVTLTLFASIVLMVIGYKMMDSTEWWPRGPATTGINNLFVLAGFYLFAASGMKTRITRVIRHPQLVGFSLWAVAHVLVNGDLASLILFGGLFVWAQAEILILNASEAEWVKPEPPAMRKEIMAVVGALVLYAVVAAIHTFLGYNPFGG